MKAIHGGKAKSDKIDSEKIARLLRGGTLPMAYVYPSGMRETRDLLRRRGYLVHKRAELMAHIQNTGSQYNLPSFGRIDRKPKREALAGQFTNPSVQLSIQTNINLIDAFDEQIKTLENYIERTVKIDDMQSFHRLKTIPGIGKILGLTLLYEIHDIGRFPQVGNFQSYARLVKCAHESAGKKSGSGGKKIGNVHLKWAFSEASVLMLRESENAKNFVAKKTKQHGKAKALSILAAKIGRAVYWLLRRKTVFEEKKFWTR
jgi:transposase